MSTRSTWDLPVPRLDQSGADVLRNSWLPLMMADADTYGEISDGLLESLFAQCLNYGPHLDEFQIYLIALLDLLDANGDETNPADVTWFEVFQRDFTATYCDQGPTGTYTVFPPLSEQFRKLDIDRMTYLPRQYEWYGRVPVGRMEIKFLAKEFLDMFDDDRLKTCMSLVTGLILLQYAYLPELLRHENPNNMYPRHAAGRVLVRDHNAFCERYGLPTLIWASDAVINNID